MKEKHRASHVELLHGRGMRLDNNTNLTHHHSSKSGAWLVGADKLSHNHLQYLYRWQKVCQQQRNNIHQNFHPFKWPMPQAGNKERGRREGAREIGREGAREREGIERERGSVQM